MKKLLEASPELTESLIITLHRALWDFVFTTGQRKNDWPEWDDVMSILYKKFKVSEVVSECFLCMWSRRSPKLHIMDETCNRCPMDWNFCSCDGLQHREEELEEQESYFWRYNDRPSRRIPYSNPHAAVIRDLQERRY